VQRSQSTRPRRSLPRSGETTALSRWRKSAALLSAVVLAAFALVVSSATAKPRTVKVTAVVTKVVAPRHGADGGPQLEFRRAGKRVGHTFLPCNPGAGLLACRGTAVAIKGVPKFDTLLFWSGFFCPNARKGCPKGTKQATGDINTATGQFGGRKIGRITMHTTAGGLEKKGNHFGVTIHLN
jgi:hypothetical protein